MTTLTIIAAIVCGAVYRRWYGGGFASAPRWARVAVGVALAAAAAWQGPVWWTVSAALIVGLGWIPAHGRWMTMGRVPKGDPSFFGFSGWIGSTTSYDFHMMALRYSAVSVPLGLAAYFLAGSSGGLVIMSGGIFVALAYLLAWEFASNEFQPTVVGEYVAGAILYGSIGVIT